MQEDFLQFIWRLQYFDKTKLRTSQQNYINIIYPGNLNTNTGPDFLNSKIKIDTIEWNGHVEIHINASDWYAHKHNQNDAYNNVILHVVWNNDQSVYRKDGTLIPTLTLKDRVDLRLIKRYKHLVNNHNMIPCASQISKVNGILKVNMQDKVLMERLEYKSKYILSLLRQNKNDWEETTYQLLAKNFGFKINSESLGALSKSVPLKVILKEAGSIVKIEALLLGQAGFLESGIHDSYLNKLKQEYNMLYQKYRLVRRLKSHEWKFLRLRPANFPTIRIVQFAAILYKRKNLFSLFRNTLSLPELEQKLTVSQSEYWRNHFHFGKVSSCKIEGLGKASIQNLIINTAVPLLAAYAKEQDEQRYMQKAIQMLEEIPAEKNKIISSWSAIGIKAKKAFDSQALIQLYNMYCIKKKCLSCSIGVHLVQGSCPKG